MAIWEAIVLGIVQGLTEFLPISSTAHLVVARELMGHKNPEDAFTVVVQLGTLVAVYVYFRAEIAFIIRGVCQDLVRFRIGSNPGGRLAWLIVLGTVPAVVVGFTLHKQLKEHFFTLQSIAIVAIVYALLLGAAEWWTHRRARRGLLGRSETQIGWLDALWIGLWQACALMPGGSRSGTTITGGLFAGLSRSAAARFSFLLSLPIILGAGLKELAGEYKKMKHPTPGEPASLFASNDDLAALLIGMAVAGVVGYFVIAWLLRFLQRYSTDVFIVYRVLFGVTILSLLGAGVLKNHPDADLGTSEQRQVNKP
jgi:undecaprenyl-diphosphatase